MTMKVINVLYFSPGVSKVLAHFNVWQLEFLINRHLKTLKLRQPKTKFYAENNYLVWIKLFTDWRVHLWVHYEIVITLVLSDCTYLMCTSATVLKEFRTLDKAQRTTQSLFTYFSSADQSTKQNHKANPLSQTTKQLNMWCVALDYSKISWLR